MATIHIWDAELKGCGNGVFVEWDDGQQIGSWPMGVDDAVERVREEYGDEVKIEIHE